jgi:hypothetical protein
MKSDNMDESVLLKAMLLGMCRVKNIKELGVSLNIF